MGQTCKLKRKERGDGKYSYEWSSKDLDDDTYVFSDRPYRIASSVPTLDFFKNFGDMFSKETGGRPNGVMTFRHEDADVLEGPLIAVYIDAAYKKSSDKYVYELSQSKDQGEVNALDDFFRDGDEVEYEACSMFIDSVKESMKAAVVRLNGFECNLCDWYDGQKCECWDKVGQYKGFRDSADVCDACCDSLARKCECNFFLCGL